MGRKRQELLGVSLTRIAARGVDLKELRNGVAVAKAEATRRIATSAAEIRKNIQSYELFFLLNGHVCPLTSQFDHAVAKGLPNIFPAIDLLLAVELGYGVLAGIQDLAKTRGVLRFEVAEEGESFEGMRFPAKCRKGEIVVRDDDGVVASLFQGPDKRTKLQPTSTDLLVLVFAAPTTLLQATTDAEDALWKVLNPCARECFVQKGTL